MNEDYEVLSLANSANERRKKEERQYNKSQIERMNNKPLRNSLKEEDIKYVKRKKKQSKKGIIRVITAIAITATIITAGVKTVKGIHNLTNYGTFEDPSSSKGQADILIDKYYIQMNNTASQETRIETVTGNNNIDRYDDPYVDYRERDIRNFSNYMLDSSNIDEAEFRSAIFAASKVINEPYMEEIFNKSVAQALLQQEKDTSTLSTYIQGNNNYAKNYLNNLGYEDWNDYKENERNNIANLIEVTQGLNNKGKGI